MIDGVYTFSRAWHKFRACLWSLSRDFASSLICLLNCLSEWPNYFGLGFSTALGVHKNHFLLRRNKSHYVPEPCFTSQLFRRSIRVPAFTSTTIIVPVLHGKIAIISAGYTFMGTTGVVFDGDYFCFSKI